MGASQSQEQSIFSTTTIVGYVVVFACAGVYLASIYTSRQRDLIKVVANKAKEQDKSRNGTRKDKAKKQRMESFVGEAKKAPAKIEPIADLKPTTLAAEKKSKDELDNNEFARQFSKAKEGTKLTAKAAKEAVQRSVKQSQVQEKVTTAVSTVVDTVTSVVAQNGIAAPTEKTATDNDADTDVSASTSPSATAADATGVADMLEKSTSNGPSVLRLTDTAEKPQYKKAAKPAESVETKKQRQNKRKTEAAKLAREEDEKDRKVKMEAQRRAARIAEGRAAKDGAAYTATQTKPAVWTTNGKSDVKEEAKAAELLDTFEPEQFAKVQAVSTNPEPVKSTAPAVKKTEDWKAGLPSEEEQMALLQQDEEWSTVPSKGKAKKAKKANDSSTSGSNDGRLAPLKLAPTMSKPVAANSTSKQNESGGAPVAPTAAAQRPKGLGKESSFAALSKAAPTGQKEVEWDV